MITIAEYRAWAEESLKWAGEAKTANECAAYLKIAETWLQSALRSERLSAGIYNRTRSAGRQGSTRILERVLARALNAQLARAIFHAAQKEHPQRRILLRRGSRTIADSVEYCLKLARQRTAPLIPA